MLKTLGIVEVCEPPAGRESTRSCRSLAGRRFGGKSLLEWVVRRVTDCQQLDRVVVVCGAGPQESVVCRCAPPDVSVFIGPSGDPLACFDAALGNFSARAAVRVSVGKPFVDPTLIDRLVTSAESDGGCDYASFCCSDGRPAVLSQIGVLAEWCRAEAIHRAAREATEPLDRWDCTRYLYRHPDLFRLRLIPVPPQLDREDLRLGIDVEEDWEHVQVILDALGPEGLEWQCIAGLLDHHPAMRRRMAMLNRASAKT